MRCKPYSAYVSVIRCGGNPPFRDECGLCSTNLYNHVTSFSVAILVASCRGLIVKRGTGTTEMTSRIGTSNFITSDPPQKRKEAP